MRFWRRGVADETAPDPDAIPPEAAEVATAKASEIATAERVAAIPVPEPESAYETPSEQLQRWFGRLRTGVAGEVVEALRRTRFDQEIAPDEVRAALADEVIRLVEPVQKPLRIDPARRPFVILVVGVNGSGKTTTIGKLAKQYRDAGRSVMLAAGDTFRAAAVEQLQIWGERADAPVMTRPTGSDAAGLAYDAFERAKQDGAEILLIDTAGRLQNKTDLMGELQKIVRVLKKVDANAPHAVLLVLDATVGQNAHAQAEIFREMVGVTGIVMTKLDGTAKGGVLVSLAEKYGIPIHAIGIGEGAEDLRPFEARAYARSLVGLDA
jgi:fused signal recognition particle receptor